MDQGANRSTDAGSLPSPTSPRDLNRPAETAARPGNPPQNPQSRPGFLHHLHWFRGLAMLVIIIRHCESLFQWTPPQEQLLDVIFRDTSGLFFFISGYLFIYLSRKYEFKSYLAKKLEWVVCPYLLWSVPSLVIYCSLSHRPGLDWLYEYPIPARAAYFLVSGRHLAPFWFMPVVFLFYLTTPFFYWASRPGRPFWIVVSLGIASSLLFSRGSRVIGSYEIANFLHFLGFLTLGMAFGRERGELEARLVRFRWPLLVSLAAVTWLQMQFPSKLHFHLLTTIQKLLLAITLLVWLKSLRFPLPRALSRIADVSFGMYFVHGYIVPAFKAVLHLLLRDWESGDFVAHGTTTLRGNVWLYVPAAIGVAGLSYIVCRLIQYLAGKRSHWIIGC